MFVLLLLVLALVVTVGGIVAIGAVALAHQRRRIAAENQVVPGTATRAPTAWARSHDPEARLHRRLRDAMTALRAVTAYDTAATVTLRADLEQSALALDDHLVAISMLRPDARTAQLAQAERAVAAVEAGVADYATAATQPDLRALEADLAGVRERLRTADDFRRGIGS
ncbi:MULTISPECIES: hypothetical protein [Nocardia]|uniref:Uncharacterized protein n=2 Tax=Nocardia TaxID=1817 RepID=A0A2T2ZCT8_9NOCA|nr:MULTISPECIES: hypothetical protein [Nocardia]MBF6447444.1 hypothetical protein [Nocardia elegans]PSR65585.1 hypothetical protein C8259_05670 [Nocardia nova]